MTPAPGFTTAEVLDLAGALEKRQRAPARRRRSGHAPSSTSSGSGRSTASRPSPAAASRAGSRRPRATGRSRSAAPGSSASAGVDLDAAPGGDRRGGGGRPDAAPTSWSTGPPRASSRSATRSRPRPPSAVARARRSRHRGLARDRRRPRDRRRRRARRSASRRIGSSPTSGRPRRPTSSTGCRPAVGSWRWSATASTTPRPSPSPMSASRSGPARTSPSRRPDITLIGGDPRGVAAAIDLSRATMRDRPPEPRLGVRLQHRADPGRDGRALPAHRADAGAGPRRGGDGALVRLGRDELASAAVLRRATGRLTRLRPP